MTTIELNLGLHPVLPLASCLSGQSVQLETPFFMHKMRVIIPGKMSVSNKDKEATKQNILDTQNASGHYAVSNYH